MGKFVKGDVVVLPFPFSDLSGSKRRPALVLKNLSGDDFILLQITSKHVKDNLAVPLTEKDFSEGSLKQESNIRPNKIFTADSSLILYCVGKIKQEKIDAVISSVVDLLQAE
jgi:mRNA interferase MazF